MSLSLNTMSKKVLECDQCKKWISRSNLSRHRRTQHCVFCEHCNKYVSSKHFHFEKIKNYVQVWIPCLVKPDWLVDAEPINQFLNDFDNSLVVDRIVSCMKGFSDNMMEKSLQELLIDFDLSIFCLGIHFSSKNEEREMKDKVFNQIINENN